MGFSVLDVAKPPQGNRANPTQVDPKLNPTLMESRKRFSEKLKGIVPKQSEFGEPIPLNDNRPAPPPFQSQPQRPLGSPPVNPPPTPRPVAPPLAAQEENLPNSPLNEGPNPGNDMATDPALTDRLALLARKEKAFTAKMLDVKAREDALAAKDAEYQSSYIPKKKLSEDPLGTLNDNGLTYDQLTEMVMSQGQKQDPVYQAMEKRMQALESMLNDQNTRYQDNAKKQYEQAVQYTKSEVSALVENDPTFELLKATDSVDEVVKLIEDTFKNEGTLLSAKEAAQKIEDDLFAEAMKMASVNKIKSKFGPPVSETTPVESPQGNTIRGIPPKTLTNEMQTRSLLPPPKQPNNWAEWKKQLFAR